MSVAPIGSQPLRSATPGCPRLHLPSFSALWATVVVKYGPRTIGKALAELGAAHTQSQWTLHLDPETRATAPMAGSSVNHRPMVTTIDVPYPNAGAAGLRDGSSKLRPAIATGGRGTDPRSACHYGGVPRAWYGPPGDRDQEALICCWSEPVFTSIRRGFAFSATGMTTVSTPAS